MLKFYKRVETAYVNGRVLAVSAPDFVMSMMGITVMFVLFGIGAGYEYIGEVYVRGPCAFGGIAGLMGALFFATSSWDEAREKEREQEEG